MTSRLRDSHNNFALNCTILGFLEDYFHIEKKISENKSGNLLRGKKWKLDCNIGFLTEKRHRHIILRILENKLLRVLLRVLSVNMIEN